MASEEHTSESLLIQAREAEIIGSTGPGNEFHKREMRKVEASLGPDFVTHGDIHESEIVVQGNDAALGTATFFEAPCPKKVAFEDIHKVSKDALHNKIQDQGQFGEEISIVHENIDLTSCIEVSEILQDEKSTELMELAQEVNEVNADAALETVICDEEESREMITQVGNLKVHPYVTSQSEIGEIIEDRMEGRLSEAEEIPLASQMGDFALLTDATLQATVEKERMPDVEETDKDQMLNLGQTRTALEEVGIEDEESHPRNDSESTEEIEDVISDNQNEVETKSESIEKVESIILNKELDDSENVLVTQNEHAIPKIFDKEEAGLILRQASHPPSEATLQAKLESREMSGEKNQISQEYWFENDQAPCVENLDDQGEPSSDECLRTNDAEMTLLVESSEAINVKCIEEEQQGVADEEEAKDYDKPSNEFSEYIEQDDFDKQGQDFISVEETREGQTEEGKEFTEKESLLTETELKGMSRSTCISVQDKNANELDTAPPLVDQIGEHEVKQQEQDPRNEEVEEWELVSETNKEYNATEQENILETNVSKESIESEMGNITLISRYDNMDGTEKQRAIHDTDTSATKELNVTPKDGTQQTKFTEEKDEYIGAESPIHDNEQEDARGQMNSELSGVKDETSDNGDNENSAEEMQIDTGEEFTENNKVKGTLADCLTEKVAQGYQDDEKEDMMLSQEAAKAEQEDISVSSLAVKHETSGEGEYFDLSRVEDEATSIGNNENTAVDPNKKMTKDNTDDGLEVYELHEKTFDNLAALRQEVKIEDEYFSNNSLDVKDETGAEVENEHLMRLKGELGENEDNKFLTDIQEVNNISEGTISQDNAREEQKIQMEDVPQESLAEKIISQSENTVENVMQMKHTSDEFVEISGTSPESPAKELVVGHSDDREAKKFPEEIVENLSIVSKELEIEQSEQSIDSSIEKNETAAEGEDKELAEHQADDNVAKESAFEAKSENFQDDKAKEQISKPKDVSPELMEENIHPQNNTEESQVQTEDTSRQFTEDENVKGCSPEHSVSESHIQDAKETKDFHEEKYENRCIESLELEKEQECQIQDFSEDETKPGGSDETLKVQEHLKDGNSIENYPKAGIIVSENENADEEKVQSEDSSKIFTEDDHVTSTGERVESNVNDSKVVEELSEEVDDTNEQSLEESNLVDTPPESLAKETAEASSGDGHEEKGRTGEQHEEENNLDTPSQSLEKKKAETSTYEGDIEKDVTEDIKTLAGENFPVEYADDEREPKDLSHDSSILNHATIAMEDNEAMEEEHKLLNEHITGEASLSAGQLIQHDDSIDAVNIQNEDAPEKCIEESTIPQDDKNEEQNAQIEDNNEELRKDEHATNISPGYPIQEVLQRTANDGKEEKEYNEKKCETFLTESTETESNNEVTKLNSSIPDDESANKNVEKLTADEDVQDEIIIYKAPSAITAGVIQDDTASSKGEEYLANSVSPDDEGIDQKALAKDKTQQETGTGKQIDKLADLDICEEHDQMQKEETPEQSDEISATRDDEKLRVEASPKDEKIIEETSPVAENVISQNNETKEEMQMEGTNEKNPEESNLVDTPFEPQEEKTTETSTEDGHEAKESTEEVTITAGEKFSIEHAEVVREPKELDHDSSISNHATITTEDNEGEIVEQKLEDQQTPREAYISEGTAIHQDDSSDAVKIQKEAAPEKSIAETATSITPEYPIEEALQRTTNDGEEENKDSEQKCESPLLESNEVEEACEGAKLKSSVPNNETVNESVELTEAENVKDENVSDKASSAITDEVIQDNISLFKGKEFPADSLSVADEDIDQKAVVKDKTEQSTYTGTEIDELANLDESDKYNDQMGKEGTPEKFEDMTEDYKMETTQEELTKEYNTGISVESPDEKIVNISADNGEKESELNEEISENGNDQKLTAESLPDDEKRIEEASLAKETAETSTENDHKSTEGTSEQYKEENYHVDTPSESLEAKETETSTDDGHEANDITEEATTMGKSISIEDEVVKEPEDLDHDSLASRSATTTIEDNEGVTVEQKQKDEHAMGEASLSAGNTIFHDNNIDVVKIQNEDAPERRMEESTTLQNDKNEEHNAHIEDKIEELTINEHATSISPEYPIEEVLQSTTNDGEEEKEGSEQKLESFLTESTEIETSNENVKKFIAENVRDESIIDEASSAITDEVDQNDVALCKGEEFLAASASPDNEGIDQKALPNDKTEQATDTGKEIHELVDLDKSEKLNDEMQKETSEQSVNMTEEYRMETTHEQLTREYSTGTSAESPDEKIVVDADNVKKETDFNEESNVNQINQSVEHTAVGADHEDLGFQISDPENATSTKGENEELMEKSPDQENIIEDTSPSAGYSIPCDDQKLLAEASPEDEKRIVEASHAKETAETSTENEHASVDGTGEQLNVENYHVDTPSESSEAKETETSTDDGYEAKEMREEVTTEASPDDEKEIVEASLSKEMAETSTEKGPQSMESTSEALPDDLKRIEEASLAKETAETSTENDHESTECTSEQCKEEDYHVDTPSESLEAKETERSTDDGHEAKDLGYQTSDPENATNTKGENEELTEKSPDHENITEDTSTSAVHSIPCDDQNLLAEASPEDEKRLVEASLAKQTAETSTENGHESIDGTREPPTVENYHVDTPSESSEAKETETSIDDGRQAKEIREEITTEASPEDEKEIVEAFLAKEMAETSTENGQESMESTSEALPDDEKRIDEASLAKETAETSTENDHESTEGTSEQYKEENYHVDTPSESLEGKETETSTGDEHEANDITEEVTTMGQSISIEDKVVKEPEDLDHDSLASRSATTTIEDNEGVKIQKEDGPEKSMEESTTLQNDKTEEQNAQIEDKSEELTINERATSISPEYPIEEVLQCTKYDGEEEKEGSEQKLERTSEQNNVENYHVDTPSESSEAKETETSTDDGHEAKKIREEVTTEASPEDEKEIEEGSLGKETAETSTEYGQESMESNSEALPGDEERIVVDADNIKKETYLNEERNENQINQSVEHTTVVAEHEDRAFQTSDPENATSTKEENEELTEKSPDQENIIEDASPSVGYSIPRDDQKLLAEESPEDEKKIAEASLAKETAETSTDNGHESTDGTSGQYNVENYHVDTPSESSEAKEAETSTEGEHEAKEIKEEVTTEASPEDEKEIAEASLAKETAETSTEYGQESMESTSEELPDDEERIIVDADNIKKETDLNEENNENQINQSVEHTAVGAEHEDLAFQTSDPENATSTKGETEELTEKSPDQENIIEYATPSVGHSIPRDDQKLLAEESPEDEKKIAEASLAKETAETSTENGHESTDGTSEQYNVENYHVDTPSESSEAKEAETSTEGGHEAKEIKEEVTTEASPEDEKEIAEASLAKETAKTSTEYGQESMERTSEELPDDEERIIVDADNIKKETDLNEENNENQINQSVEHTAVGAEHEDLAFQTSDPENATSTKGENEELTEKSPDQENIIEDASPSVGHSIPRDDQKLLAEESPEDEKKIAEASLAKETAETSTENGHESTDGTSEQYNVENYHVDTPSESSEAKEAETSTEGGHEAKEIKEEVTTEASREDERERVEASLEKETAETSTENDHESTEGTSEQYKEENYHVDTPSESLEVKKIETSTDDGHEAKDITEEVIKMGESFSIEDAEVVKEPEDLSHVSLATRTEDAPEKSIEESATLQNDKNEEKNAQIEDKGEELTLNEHATNISPEYPIEEVLQWTTNDGEEEKDSEQKLESFLAESTEIERNPKGAKLESTIPINETSNENVKNFTAENESDENKIDEASSAITAELDQDEAAVCKDEESVAVCLSPDDEGIDQKALPNDKTEQATDTGKEIDDLADLDKSGKHDDKMQKETSGHSGEMTEEYGMETTHEDLTREYNTGTSTEFPDEKIINDADYVKKKNELNEKSDENQSVERAAVGADHEDLGFQTSDPGNATSTKGENEELTEKSPDKEKITEDISLSAGYSVPRDDRIEERKVKIEDVTHESVEGNTVSQHDDTEQDYMEKDQISQQIEGSHATVTSAEIPVKISNESSTVDENKTNASITEERENLSTQENNETLTAQNDAQEEIIQVSSAITAEQMPDNASIYNTEQFLSTDSSKEGKGREQTSEHNMAEDKSEQTADVLSKMGQTATTNQIEEQNDQIQREEITEQLIEETDIVAINDQTREPTENEVSEENFGKANADERNTEKNKEIVSIPETEGSEKEIVLETTAAHVEASSTASDVDCIFEEHEESLSLGQNVDSGIQVSGIYTTEQDADEGHAVPDDVPDDRERNYNNDEVTIEPIKEVEGGTTEATETVNEGHVADALEKSDTEMQMESEGQVEADFIKKFHEDNQVNIPSQLTTDSKFSGPEEVKITEEGNSRALEGDDTMIYESRKDNLEDEENQDDFARVQESALQTETVTVISEKDGAVTKFNGSIQEVENSASAEMVEQKQQYEASNPKTNNFLGEENHNSDSLVEKHEHEMAIGTEKENEKLSEHPSDSTKEDTTEKRSQNDEDTLKEEAESSLEVEGLINKAEDENKVTEESALIEQVLLEPEGKDGVKFSIQTSENRSDAPDLQQDEMKTVVISPESGQEEGENAVYSDSTTETQSSNITKTPCTKPEASPRAETLDECTLLEERGEHLDNTTIRENELSEERINENLESDDLVKKIEHDTTSGNEEANKNLTEHPFNSTIKDVTEERQQNDEVIQTDERETTIADQVPVEHEDEMKEKGIHKTAENQIDTTYLQLEETKTVASTESSQKGEQKVIDLNSITEADSSEPSTVEKTENECHFPEERCQSSINSTKKEDELSEERTIKENLISETVVKKHENEIASSETNDKPSSYPSDLTKEDIIEERLRNNDATPTEEVGSNLDTNSTVNREASENEVTENLIITDQVLTRPANVDSVRSIQETTENQIDDNHLEHDEIKQKAIDATNITENESSDITETPYKQPEALAVAETAEECGLEEEKGLSSQNTTEGNNEPSKKIINEVSMEPKDENKVLSIQEAADNQNDANELLHKEIKTGISFESVTNGKEMATDSNNIPETESSDKMETPYNNSDASIIVRTSEECGVPEGTGQSPENYSIREQQQSQINKEEVVMEPEDEDEAKIIQELLERRNDITDLQHDEMQAVTSSESVQNESAMNFDKTTETENLDKMDMLCNESEISNVVNTLEECDLSEERNKVETVEAERSLKQTHWEEEITCFKTSSGQKSEQTVDNFEIIGNEEGGRIDLNDIQKTDYHLPVTCKRKGNDDAEVELPAEGVAKQIKVVPTEAHRVMEEGFIQIKENPVIERMVSNSIEEETTCVSPSYNNWKHFEEIIKNEMEADEPPPPNEEDEPLQGVSFEEHSASTEGMEKTEADLKSMSNETEEQQFSELVLYEQMHKGSLLTEEIAEENMERVQQLEEKNTGYSSPEQVKDKNLHEEVPREPDVQILDFDTSKSLQQKEDVAQEASKTDPEIIMQPRDFSSEIQYTVFSTESEKTTEIDTFIHSYLQETKDVEKVQATGIPDRKLENLFKETTDVDSQLTGSLEQIHEPHDELNISEETTNTCEKHMAKNSDTTTEELSTEEGSKLCNVIVNEVPYDQNGKGHEVIAKTNQVEEDKGDAKKYHQVAREYSQEERGIDDVLLRSEKNLMETVERKSSTREHKGKDNLQVVSTEADLSASQQTQKAQEVSISEETTDTYEKHKAKNSDITIEELSTEEGSKLRNVIANEGPYDQIGKGDEVVAKTNQVEEDKGDTKKHQQLAREYTQEERGIDDVLLRSEKNFMETLERESSTREHKAEDYWQVVSAEDVSASQQTEKAQEVLIEGLAHHGEIEEKQDQMQAYSIKIEETGKTEIKEDDVIRRAIPEEKEEECEEAGLIAATIPEGSREMDVKAPHKKSHNLLSGVGSRVKQSISKVKKAIIGKPSQPKNPSPKKATAKGE